MKRAHMVWIAVIVMAVALVLAAGVLSPTWRHGETPDEFISRRARIISEHPPAPDPGEGRVTRNLLRALRLDRPVLAFFDGAAPDEHELVHHPEERERAQRQQADREVLARLARDYEGVLAVVRLNPGGSPASFQRRQIETVPTTIIFSADDEELWRYEGLSDWQATSTKLAELGINPTAQAQEQD